ESGFFRPARSTGGSSLGEPRIEPLGTARRARALRCARDPGALEEAGLLAYHFDTQSFLFAAHDMDGGEFAALDARGNARARRLAPDRIAACQSYLMNQGALCSTFQQALDVKF